MGQLRPPRRAWEKSDPWHFYCPGWKERLHSSNYMWRGRRKHSQRLSGLPNHVCAHVCAHARMCALRLCPLCWTNPLNRSYISLYLINSLTPMAESKISFLAKKSQSTPKASKRPWLLSFWPCNWNKFIFNNSTADTWVGTFLLQHYELHFLSPAIGLLLLCRTLLHKLEINSKSMEDKFMYRKLHPSHLIQSVPLHIQPALTGSLQALQQVIME